MKTGILVISLEMPASQVIDRLVAKIGGISLRSLSGGVKTPYEIHQLGKALTALDFSDLVVRDDLHDVTSIVSAARAMAKSECGLAVVLVDYIQLVRCDLGRDSTREREVAEVSRALRLMSVELGCLVIGITQLNEQGKARESRAIGQDATCVMIVKATEDEDKRDIIIPIQRNGPSGVKTTLAFNPKMATFKDLAFNESTN